MIDFATTRPGIDPQAQACARLMTMTIVQAIKDACLPPSKDETAHSRNLKFDASSAIQFLFDDRSIFEEYAALLDLPADGIRAAILGYSSSIAGVAGLTDGERRILRIRYRWFQRRRVPHL